MSMEVPQPAFEIFKVSRLNGYVRYHVLGTLDSAPKRLVTVDALCGVLVPLIHRSLKHVPQHQYFKDRDSQLRAGAVKCVEHRLRSHL